MAESFFFDVHFSEKNFSQSIGAPELGLANCKYGPPQDVYRFGLVALWALTFTHPWKKLASPQQVYRAQMENSIPPELLQLREKEPMAADLIYRCLLPAESRLAPDQILLHPYLCEEGVEPLKLAPVDWTPQPPPIIGFQREPSSGQLPAAASGSQTARRDGNFGKDGNGSSNNGGDRKPPLFLKCYLVLDAEEGAEKECIRVRVDGLSNISELRNFSEAEFSEAVDPWPDNLVLK